MRLFRCLRDTTSPRTRTARREVISIGGELGLHSADFATATLWLAAKGKALLRYHLDGGWDKISTGGLRLDEPKTFRLPVIRGQTFIGTQVALDNTRFENCVFKDCDITYHGGPAETSACYFENVRWVFEGVAGTIVTVMQGLGWKITPPA